MLLAHPQFHSVVAERDGRVAGRQAQSNPMISDRTVEIPTGKASLIRASYEAGMKPYSIARSLRVSLSTVNKVWGL